MNYNNILDSDMSYIYNDNANDYNIMKSRLPADVYASGAGAINTGGGYGYSDYSIHNQETYKPKQITDSDKTDANMTCISNDKLNAIKKENQEFVENQSKQMLVLIDVMNAYKTDNNTLQQQIKQYSENDIKIKEQYYFHVICLIILLLMCLLMCLVLRD